MKKPHITRSKYPINPWRCSTGPGNVVDDVVAYGETPTEAYRLWLRERERAGLSPVTAEHSK